jgi:hypothetical protein
MSEPGGAAMALFMPGNTADAKNAARGQPRATHA